MKIKANNSEYMVMVVLTNREAKKITNLEWKNWESLQNNFKKETNINLNKFTHDKSKVLCFKCKEYGHFENKCPSKKEAQSNLIEEDLEPTLLMATVKEVTRKYDQPGLKEDHNNESGSNQKNMINLD
uniref:Zinc finger, CCHC-type n=1 Tax=Tanacetum cinerariifolium TaxID=118510 RepID=A0A699K6Y9_TANCI|nr:zinc finger, CCHC-type [Tanacetum cinerariifolium]